VKLSDLYTAIRLEIDSGEEREFGGKEDSITEGIRRGIKKMAHGFGSRSLVTVR